MVERYDEDNPFQSKLSFICLRKVKSIEKAAGKEISAVKGRSVGMGEFFRLWKKVLIGNG